MSKKVVGFVNLYDSPNLGQLTEHRTIGSTSFLGRFAIMDFALSNFTNSEIDNVNILIKNNFRSVAKHVGSMKAWVNNTKRANQNLLINEKGIANAKENTDIACIKHNDWVLYDANADIIVVAPAHIITRIDFRKVIEFHDAKDADITIVYQNISNADKAFLTGNVLKLKDGKVISSKKNNGKTAKASVSLETYVIGANTLNILLHDSEYSKLKSLKKVIEKVVSGKSARVFGYEYKGYARCFETCQNFVDYSFELLEKEASTALFGKLEDGSEWPAYTLSRNTQPTLYGATSKVKNSFIANGAKIDGTVEGSIISRDVVVAKGAVVKNSIVLASTYIDAGARVEHAVIDKLCHIAANASVKGKKTSPTYVEQGKLVK